jgi:tRNA (mo5U34)-methyltransferase
VVTPQPVQVKHRDPARALDFFRLPPGSQPPTWAPKLTAPPGADPALVAEVDRLPWYHTIELPGGIVTPGMYDQRRLLPHYGIPADLTGKRVLDIATFDGFWAFEFERRGGTVTAVDIDSARLFDLPPQAEEQRLQEGSDIRLGETFALVKRVLGSQVDRVVSSVYDLDPASLGTFDMVHMGDLLLHLERPLEALRRVRALTAGFALLCDVYEPDLEDAGGRALVNYLGGWEDITWWRPSLTALCQMVIDAGFADVRVHTTYRMATTWDTTGYWRAVLVARP